VPLRGQALATSGDYRNFYVDEAGQRRSHLLDPRTLRPVAHALAAVTVVRPTALDADGLATALFVLGPGAGRALAEREGWAALFVERTARGGLALEATPAFAALAGS
jgi:thiamine biosynthesis lipoprotein